MNRNRIEIKSLRIENFGCFGDETFQFSDRLNQIIGGNESGKSTIFKALIGAVFGVSKKGSNSSYRLTLNYSENDIDFELIRTDDLIGLHDSSGLDYAGNQLTNKLNQQWLGGGGLYLAAFCFTSESGQLDGKPIGQILDQITSPLFGEFDKPRVEQFLQTEINRIEYQSSDASGASEIPSAPAEPGELEMTADILSKFLKEKYELEENLSLINPDLIELEKVQLTQSQLEAEIVDLEDSVAGAQAYGTFNDRMVNLEERLNIHVNNYSRASQLTDDLGRVEKELGHIHIPDQSEAEEISNRYDELEVEVEKNKQEMDRLISRRGKANAGFWVATLVLVIVCLINILNANGTISSGWADRIIPYIVPAVALVWITRLFSFIFYFVAKKKATTLFRSHLSQFDAYCAEINSRFHLKAAHPIRAISDAIARKSALTSMVINLKKTIGLLTQSSGLPHMEEVTKEIEQELIEINGELAPLLKYSQASARLGDLRQDLIARKVRLKSLKEHLGPLAEKCAPTKLIKESIEGIDRELVRLKDRHNDLSRQVEILKVTRTALNNVSSKLIEKIHREFNCEILEMFSKLTGQADYQLRISEHRQAIEVKLNEDEGWIGVERLNSRSILTVSILAIKLVAAGRIGALPIIFDQADIGIDDRRFDLWQKQIAMIGSDHQVINLSLRSMPEAGRSHDINLNNMAYQPSV